MVQQQEIQEIVEVVFETILGFNIQVDSLPVVIDSENALKGVVHISGAWNGAVVVNVSGELAKEATAKVFGLPRDSCKLEDKQDTIAELANMIGGNVKSLLPGPSSLSLPMIVAGRDLSLRLHGAEVVSDMAFRAADFPMDVRLYCFANDGARARMLGSVLV